MTTYCVSVYVEVTDEADVIEAARRHLIDDHNYSDEQAREAVPDDEVSNALRLLIDPGMSPPGTKIIDSDCNNGE